MKLKNITKTRLSIRDSGNLIIVNPGKVIEVTKPSRYNKEYFKEIVEQEKVVKLLNDKKPKKKKGEYNKQ